MKQPLLAMLAAAVLVVPGSALALNCIANTCADGHISRQNIQEPGGLTYYTYSAVGTGSGTGDVFCQVDLTNAPSAQSSGLESCSTSTDDTGVYANPYCHQASTFASSTIGGGVTNDDPPMDC